MNLFNFMVIYQEVFQPTYFLLLSALIILLYDWKNSAQPVKHLFGRFAVISPCFIVGLLLKDTSVLQIEDVAVLSGFILSVVFCVILWRKFEYGREVLCGITGLIAVSVPYMIISYFWNISGHVTFTAAPVTYLIALDRRLAPLYVIPVLMVFNRIVVGAHDPVQSVAGFFLGTLLVLVGVKCLRNADK